MTPGWGKRLAKLLAWIVGFPIPYLLGVLVAHLADVKPDGFEWAAGVIGYLAVLGAIGIIGAVGAAWFYVKDGGQ